MCHPILNMHVIIEGKPHDKPALYVCNHRSFADPLAILPYLDAYVIAKAEVASYPIINKGAELTGVLYVKREDSQSRNAVRDKMVKPLNKVTTFWSSRKERSASIAFPCRSGLVVLMRQREPK